MPKIVRIATTRIATRAALIGLVVLVGGTGPTTAPASADEAGDGGVPDQYATADWPVSLETGTVALAGPLLYSSGIETTPIESVAPPSPRETIAAGCPDIRDDDLLRDGAADDGRGLCVRSVHEARTDEAAAAIVAGFHRLGLPYSRGRRNRDDYDDCSSFVGTSYRQAGRALSDTDWEPSSSVMRNAPWAKVVDEAAPGDILWRRGHVAIALADGYMMHASEPGDVTHVRSTSRFSRVLAVSPLV